MKPQDRCMCGKERPAIAVKLNDPFCSTTCARTHHNNPLPERSIWQRDYKSKEAA